MEALQLGASLRELNPLQLGTLTLQLLQDKEAVAAKEQEARDSKAAAGRNDPTTRP